MGIGSWVRGILGRGGPKWECTECGETHRKNPKKCKNCGSTILVQHRE